MIVIPCSASTLASIANGASDDLLARAADVCLKERRTLLLCLRETPLSRVHLQNMLRAQEAGAVIMPVVPAFYYSPQTIDDLVEQFVCRALAQIGLPQEQQYRWEGRREVPRPRSVECKFPMTTSRIRTVLEMIKFEHSIFALPFALTAALLAARTSARKHGRPRMAHMAANRLDHRGDGWRAIFCHDDQSHRGSCATTAKIRVRKIARWSPARSQFHLRGPSRFARQRYWLWLRGN